MAEHIEKTIAQAMTKLAAQEEEVRQTKLLINQLREFAGQPPQYADVAAESAVVPLRGDEYYGKKQSTACRLVLERRKSTNLGPAELDELFETLLQGGYEHEAKSDTMAKKSLYNMLVRDTAIFHRLPSGKFGLASWYPDAPKKRRRKGVKAKYEKAVNDVENGADSAEVAQRLLGEGDDDG